MRVFRLFLLTFVITACSKTPLYSKLPEPEANEVVAALLDAGIPATKDIADEKSWSVMVDKQHLAAAVDVLKAEGLPAERYNSLGDLFKKEGLVSTPSEERVRFMHGLSQELAHTLSMIDGVLSARVHIVQPANDPLNTKQKPSSASVFIKHRTDADMNKHVNNIKNIVIRGVEGLTPEVVTISFFPATKSANRAAKYAPQEVLGITFTSINPWLASLMLALWFLPIGLLALMLFAYRAQVLEDWQAFKEKYIDVFRG
jgi:type III secretion protein J